MRKRKIKIGVLKKGLNKKTLLPKKQLDAIEFDGKKIEIKQLIDTEIRLTYDMPIFKKYRYNRDTDNGGVKKIVDSARENGWIIPIIYVNSNMGVLRGQHSVLAAEILKAPVYYVISENLTPEELVALETSKRWNDLNALKAYADNGNKNAKNILTYFSDIKISLKKKVIKTAEGKIKQTHKHPTIPQLLAILYKNPRYTSGIKANGGITLFKNLEPFMINEDLMKVVDIFSYAQKNCMPEGVSIRPQYLSNALISFVFDDKHTIDLDRLRGKLETFKFYGEKSVKDYMKQLEGLYS